MESLLRRLTLQRACEGTLRVEVVDDEGTKPTSLDRDMAELVEAQSFRGDMRSRDPRRMRSAKNGLVSVVGLLKDTGLDECLSREVAHWIVRKTGPYYELDPDSGSDWDPESESCELELRLIRVTKP